jgi:hypothetical protein
MTRINWDARTLALERTLAQRVSRRNRVPAGVFRDAPFPSPIHDAVAHPRPSPTSPPRAPPGPAAESTPAGRGRSARPLSRKLEGRSKWLKREFVRGVWAQARDALSSQAGPPYRLQPNTPTHTRRFLSCSNP